MKKKNADSDCSLLIQQLESGHAEENWADKWYIRLIAYIITPFYIFLKIYDLARYLKKLFNSFLGGLLHVFLFLFCFGWLWQTPLLEKIRKTAPVKVIIRYKLLYHMLNIISTLLQAYFVRLLLPLPSKYQSHVNFTCGIFTLFAAIVSIKSPKYHCFCLLVLPTLASRQGRRVILVLLVASVCVGPIHNIKVNTDLISREMNCIGEKAKNNSDTIADLMRARYEALHTRLEGLQNETKQRMAEIQDRVEAVGEQVEKKYSFLVGIVNKVNAFADKCAATMNKLNGKCHDVFNDCDKKEGKRAVGITHYNTTERFHEIVSPVTAGPSLPEMAANQSVIDPLEQLAILESSYDRSNIYHNKSHYSSHSPSATLHSGKVYHVRQKRFWNAIKCFFKKLIGLVIRPICDIIFNSIKYLCALPKLLTHFIAGIVLQKYQYLQLTFQNNLRLEVNSSVVYEREVVEVRSAREAMEEFRGRVAERLTFTSLDWVALGDYFKLLTMLLVYVSAYKYLSAYLCDTTFDNHYLDRALEKHDRTAERRVFPLNHKEKKKYVRISQPNLTSNERRTVTRSFLKALVYLVAVVLIEGINWILQFICVQLFTYGPVTVEHTIQLTEEDEEGESLLPEDLSTVHLLFDTSTCFHQPAVTPLSLTAYHLALASSLLVLSVLQVFFMRLRHAVCDSFYPLRRWKRAEHLHSKIRRDRDYSAKHAAESVFARVSERNKLCRIFPWLYKPSCVLCSAKDFIQQCDWCETVYCVACLKDLKGTCQVCSDVTYRRKSGLLAVSS